MGRTKRTQVALYLDPEQAETLTKLAARLKRTQQSLLREGVERMLARYTRSRKRPE
jgi:predicted DNA-binding protein